MEQLTLHSSDVERAEGRRAWFEAQAAWVGAESEMWWRWFSEAAGSIGMATRTVDCSIAEAIELVDSGAELVTWKQNREQPEEPGCWLRVRDAGRHQFEVNLAAGDSQTATVSIGGVRRYLRDYVTNDQIRCVVVRHDVQYGNHETQGLKPTSRLIELLRPEWSDIWIILVFAFVVGLLTLATPIAVESLVNTVAFGRGLQPVVVLALILLTFLSFSAAMRALQSWVVELIQRRLFARIAGDLAFRLPRAKAEATDDIYLPELTNRFFDVVTVQKVAAQLLLEGIGLILTAVIGMAVLAFYHPWLLGFDVVMMACIAFIIIVLGRGAVTSAVKESKHKYYMASWLEDIGRCPTAFRTDGGAALALERTDRLVHQYLEARQKHFRILMRQILFALGLQAVASTVLLGLGGWLVISGQLTLGQLVAAELIVTVIVGAFAKLGKHMESLYDLLAAVDKLGALFDLPTEQHDGILELGSDHPVSLQLQDVQYRLTNSSLFPNPISLQLKPGSSVAVYGTSGSGKSTLIDLICGLRSPSAGHITLDDTDPQDVRPDILRGHISVARRGEIFHGTLAENVHLHRENVTSSDVRAALEMVGLYDTVLRLSKGMETPLVGNGTPLSATQQDLLCLARAIAGQPRLLLIDSILDALSEEQVAHIMDELFGDGFAGSVVVTTARHVVAAGCDHSIQLGVVLQQYPHVEELKA